ncbi:DUF4128 domain-containing protein [Pseudomonas sp. S5(2021)]|nr:DUF4128 domain-containing protein [Pseudomonas sp. S5(2021)]
MSHHIVRGLYESRLSAWASVKGLKVAWQGVAFSPPPGIYLQAFMLPALTDSIDLAGDTRTFIGVFQVSIVAPNGKGTGAAEALVAELDALFPYTLELVSGDLTVSIVKPVDPGPMIPGSTTFTLPVSFGYRADRV